MHVRAQGQPRFVRRSAALLSVLTVVAMIVLMSFSQAAQGGPGKGGGQGGGSGQAGGTNGAGTSDPNGASTNSNAGGNSNGAGNSGNSNAGGNPNDPTNSSVGDNAPGTSGHGNNHGNGDGPGEPAGNDCNGGTNDTGGGANQDGAYNNTCDSVDTSQPAPNGNGGGKGEGKPCEGCVGNADDKNPPGQDPHGAGGKDPNNGYECDGNKGIGKGNPAHTGCQTTTITEQCTTWSLVVDIRRTGSGTGTVSDNRGNSTRSDTTWVYSSPSGVVVTASGTGGSSITSVSPSKITFSGHPSCTASFSVTFHKGGGFDDCDDDGIDDSVDPDTSSCDPVVPPDDDPPGGDGPPDEVLPILINPAAPEEGDAVLGGSVARSAPGSLPFTGSGLSGLIVIGLALVVLGGVVRSVAATRRPSRRQM